MVMLHAPLAFDVLPNSIGMQVQQADGVGQHAIEGCGLIGFKWKADLLVRHFAEQELRVPGL